jgi:hypothetical protein
MLKITKSVITYLWSFVLNLYMLKIQKCLEAMPEPAIRFLYCIVYSQPKCAAPCGSGFATLMNSLVYKKTLNDHMHNSWSAEYCICINSDIWTIVHFKTILLRGIQLTHVPRYWGSTGKIVFPNKMFTFDEANTCVALPNFPITTIMDHVQLLKPLDLGEFA